jgi:transposase-like protein
MNAMPTSLLEAIRYFSDPDTCLQFVAKLRWPQGPICPQCGGREVSFISTRRIWKCKSCRKQFSVKVGTIFEDSPIGLDKWLAAIWMIVNCKNGISSYEIARDLKVTQKSAWFMLQRIRRAMQTGTFMKLSGHIEADETFIGGKARNMHIGKRVQRVQGRGPVGKAIVMGLLERTGEVRAAVIPTRKKGALQKHVREHVVAGSAVYTDALKSYEGLDADYVHGVIDHAEAYVNGQIHTNGLENFWSLLKRGLRGTYVNVQPFHLFRYLDEQVYRYNNRKMDDAGRFIEVVSRIGGRRLTWNDLTGAGRRVQ